MTTAIMNKINNLSRDDIMIDEKSKTIKALIPLAFNAQDADKIILSYRKDLAGEETYEKLYQKYSLIVNIFGINNTKNIKNNCDLNKNVELLKSNYYKLLSILILNK